MTNKNVEGGTRPATENTGGSLVEPVFDDLRKSLQFVPEQAQIWLDGRRMVLADSNELAILRRELIMAVGLERSRGILTRMGYEVGGVEAELALRVRKGRSFFEGFSAGPQLHALRGMVRVEPIKFEVDIERGRFYAEYYWTNSVECEGHLKQFGLGHVPAGWSQLGYASGYATAYAGRPIVYREVQCIAMGHERCFLIGKLLEDWSEPEEELRYFRAENYTARPSAACSRPAATDHDLKVGIREMVGTSAGFNVALHLLDKVARTDATVLFLGESGVGKEVFARELHKRSNRADKTLVAVNCAAIPETLIEAELFGVEKGAFTGATTSRPGRFERAEGGTLFLDEIGTLTSSAQGKLLRAIQEKEFERVGDTRTRKCNVRIIAATNSDLRAEIERGNFRVDLFHRLNTFPIKIPPLRERRADIPLLINHFLRRFSERYARNIPGFTEAALHHFFTYVWPGNIRELENIIERGVILAEDGSPIDLHHLATNSDHIDRAAFDANADSHEPSRYFTLAASSVRAPTGAGRRLLDDGLTVSDIVDELIGAALDRAGGNKTEAARIAGLSRSQINYWLKKARG